MVTEGDGVIKVDIPKAHRTKRTLNSSKSSPKRQGPFMGLGSFVPDNQWDYDPHFDS